MRGAAVVVGTRPVVVLRFRAVGAGVGVAVAIDVVPPSALGLSGAAAFCMCVAAKALMPVKVVKMMPVTIARSATGERRSGVGFTGRPVMRLGDHDVP